MAKPWVIYAVLGIVASLIIAIATYFVLNISSITLLKSGLLIGASVLGLIVVLWVIAMIVRGMLVKK